MGRCSERENPYPPAQLTSPAGLTGFARRRFAPPRHLAQAHGIPIGAPTRSQVPRFPILCPTCTAGKRKGKEAAGEVSQPLALDLGLTDEQYSIWTEMELVSFSILLYCRKYQRTMFVARDEHEKAKIIVCPLPDCNHAWCKQCQQSIDSNGPKHSCDGTSELDHLMK